MTEATTMPGIAKPAIAPQLYYQVAMREPQTHLFDVMLRLRGWQESVLDLKMPVWTPGSYLVREYAKHLQEFSACDPDERSLSWRKVSKNHWQIDTPGISEIIVRYRIYANELTVRTNHLDATHGYFNGAALFFYVPGFERSPIEVQIIPPNPEWHVSTGLSAVKQRSNTFLAEDFDTLVDSPFEIGTHDSHFFEVEGKSHELAIWGQGNAKPDRIISDTEKIIQVESQLFEGLPYDRYLFILHLSSQGYGGLEHKNSCSLNYPRLGFRAPEKYNRFMQLVAHEFFHLWNIKRIRPKPLEEFDYEGESYISALWFCEGTTSYYDLIIPLRAGIYDAKNFLQGLSKDVNRLQNTPGRQIQPVSESSWDAWIKLYRRDANSDNSQISYYLKGEMVSLLLDLRIRARHKNQRSLDDVMRQMWQRFGQQEIGFSDDDLKEVLESVAEEDLTDFYAQYIHGTTELPFDKYLAPFGLKLQASNNGQDAVPFLGLSVKTENGKAAIKFVETGSPAHQVGIDPEDELLAIDGLRVTADDLNERLKDYQPAERIQVTVFHHEQLQTYPVTLGEPRPTQYQVVALQKPTASQENLFRGWLGGSLSRVKS
ncbi:M61 family metallopeptidase [Phormidium sp. CCY1219]|uniref:M61 family metallopeptidase n=1 Tax=Phormidium sp. CCY1219 TaxID=2886104 RepID=UPI002D1EDBA2|nr:M61 family metallopeptidase [Phormidium sp. CCY1219]MEB3831659.1 M61 family metallopeptidase [Phormidium sp. CCY1219]